MFRKVELLKNELLYILIAIGLSLVILNMIATYVVLNTYFEVKERRLYQLIFTWLLPFVGALLVIFINLEDYFEERRKKKIGNNPNISDNEASDMAMTLSGHDHD